MDVGWGDRLIEETQGLDILGVRGLDQNLEAALVNGITTISLRGRYFSILPWAIGEFFDAELTRGAKEFSGSRFKAFLTRVEFLVLACTTLDAHAGDPSGALGSVLFQSQMAALSAGNAVSFPADRGGAMLGTYFGPCRALGLIRTAEGGGAEPYVLTPRGQAIWNARKAALEHELCHSLLWHAESISPTEVHEVAAHFSLKGLAKMPEEAAAIRDALLTPWSPNGPGAVGVAEAYKKFSQTVAWLRVETRNGPLRADYLMARAWRRTVAGDDDLLVVEKEWAEIEWRRRLHFALELTLGAVAETVQIRGEATLVDVVTGWLDEEEFPSKLSTVWPGASRAREMQGCEAVTTVPTGLYLAEAPPADLNQLRPHARALAAFALVAGLAHQSTALRTFGCFRDRGQTPGERALSCVEAASNEPFSKTLREFAEIVVQAHLATTFRKMGAGQKCSLRFFPDGSKLVTTHVTTGAGRSGSRLWNVIKVLQDAAVDGFGGNG